MNKDEHKKEYMDRIKSGEPKDFKIEKTELSNDDPILQQARRWVGGVDLDFVINQSKDLLNAPPDPDFGYQSRKTRTLFKVVESPGKFYGVKLGKLRIGFWIEVERDE